MDSSSIFYTPMTIVLLCYGLCALILIGAFAFYFFVLKALKNTQRPHKNKP